MRRFVCLHDGCRDAAALRYLIAVLLRPFAHCAVILLTGAATLAGAGRGGPGAGATGRGDGAGGCDVTLESGAECRGVLVREVDLICDPVERDAGY